MRSLFTRKIKLQIKLLATYIGSIVILCLGMLFYFAYYVVGTETSNSGKSLDAFTHTISHSLNEMLYSMDRIALQIAYNPYVVQSFQEISEQPGSSYFQKNPFKAKELSEFISSFMFLRDDNLRMCLLNKKGDFLSVGNKSTQLREIQSFYQTDIVQNWQEHFSQGNQCYFIPPENDPYSKQIYGTAVYKTFSVVRPIRNFVTPSLCNINGFVEIQKDVQQIDVLFSALPPNSIAFILDAEGIPFLHYNDEDKPLQQYRSFLLNTFSYWKKDLKKQDAYFLYDGLLVSMREVPNFGLTVMLVQDYWESSVLSILKIVVAIILLIIIFFSILQAAIVEKLTKPLKTLHKSMKSISIQNTKLEVHGRDELVEIEIAFNQMLSRLQVSMEEQVEAKTREMKSFMMALQAQLNPHFIHNVLSIISMSAEEEKYEEISEICYRLSKMLRFTASYDEASNTLEQELEYTKNYLSLMKIRYEEMFIYTIQCEDNLSNISVPKLIIQPLVENCFKHAFPELSPPWKIDIFIHTTKKEWSVEIRDNGVGFSPEFLNKLKILKQSFSIEQVDTVLSQLHMGGMSIFNIFVRLKILYKDALIFHIEEDASGGTVITIGGLNYA